MEQVDHRPQVTALFDVDLEEVAQVVERRRGLAELALLLDARRLGVGLRHDDAAEDAAELAGHLVPSLLPALSPKLTVRSPLRGVRKMPQR